MFFSDKRAQRSASATRVILALLQRILALDNKPPVTLLLVLGQPFALTFKSV